MNRTQRILLVILGIQIVLVALVFWPRGGKAELGVPLLGDINSDEALHFIIDDADGKQIKFVKKGSVWVLPEAGDFPANSDKVNQLLEKFTVTNSNRLVTRTTSSHKRLQVADDDFQRRIWLQFSGGREKILYIGSSAGAQATHVRVAGQSEVYITSEFSTWEVSTQVSNWIETSYLSLPSEEMTAVVLENVNGRFEFEKNAGGNWVMKGLDETETLDSSKLTSLLGRLANLHMTEPLGRQEMAEYGFNNPSALIEITSKDEEGELSTTTIRIGSQDSDDDDFTLHASGADYYVKVSEYTIQDFVNHTLEDFLLVEPTPTPEL